MPRTTDFASYPLSPALTLRVVQYLNAFRVILFAALAVAWYGGLLLPAAGIHLPALPWVLFGGGLLLALLFLLLARRAGVEPHRLALASLLADVVLLATLLVLFGGLDSGLGVLLVFTAAAAAIALSLRMALFIAALAALAIIGDVLANGALGADNTTRLLQAGLYGVTLFVTVGLVHALAVWMRDFRLIAERQAMTLSRLEQINELIIRRMRTGVLAVDREGEIRMLNESAWHLLGGPPNDDRQLADIAPELQERLVAWRTDPRAGGESLRLRQSQALVVPAFTALPAGLEIATLVFLEDSDVVARRASERSAHALARLSTGIAHEIRNPLSAIRHAAQMLGESEALPEADRKLTGIIDRQSARMNRIVDNILQLSRGETSRPEVLELHGWMDEIAGEFRAAHPEHALEVDAPQGEALVLFDRSQLHQVVWKLLENAVRHSGRSAGEFRGGLAVRLDEPVEGQCLLEVRDNGQGIPPGRIAEVFEPFFTTHAEGSGLGLFIARQLCEANQAELTVDSAPGAWTRFRIRMARTGGANAAPGISLD